MVLNLADVLYDAGHVAHPTFSDASIFTQTKNILCFHKLLMLFQSFFPQSACFSFFHYKHHRGLNVFCMGSASSTATDWSHEC